MLTVRPVPCFLQSVVLAERPPISIPLTSVSPALLEELISDLSSLASAYHKPASTFIGKVKYGATTAKQSAITREQGLATVVQGQNAENLLDFGDDDEDQQASSGGNPNNQSAAGGLGALDEMMAMSQEQEQQASRSAGIPSSASANTQLNDLLGL